MPLAVGVKVTCGPVPVATVLPPLTTVQVSVWVSAVPGSVKLPSNDSACPRTPLVGPVMVGVGATLVIVVVVLRVAVHTGI